MKLNILYCLLFIFFLSSCATMPEDVFRLTKKSLYLREMQSKQYYKLTEKQIFIAAVEVLQDTGFIIKKNNFELGVITGEKVRDATDGRQVAANIAIALLGGQPSAIDKDQKIRVSVVTRKRSNNSVIARVSFQRIVWNTNNQVTRMEYIENPEIYSNFFYKLNKAVFLEKEGV